MCLQNGKICVYLRKILNIAIILITSQNIAGCAQVIRAPFDIASKAISFAGDVVSGGAASQEPSRRYSTTPSQQTQVYAPPVIVSREPVLLCSPPTISSHMKKRKDVVVQIAYRVTDEGNNTAPVALEERFWVITKKDQDKKERFKKGQRTGQNIVAEIVFPKQAGKSFSLTYEYTARNNRGMQCQASNSIKILQ